MRYAAVGVVVLAVGVGVFWRRQDVGRVDLAAILDKYVAETERRLDALFGRAEELDTVLLLDEGDELLEDSADNRDQDDVGQGEDTDANS